MAILETLAAIQAKLLELEAKIDAPKSVQRLCHHCGGDGIKVIGAGSGSCPDCGGDGHTPFGRITLKTEE